MANTVKSRVHLIKDMHKQLQGQLVPVSYRYNTTKNITVHGTSDWLCNWQQTPSATCTNQTQSKSAVSPTW